MSTNPNETYTGCDDEYQMLQDELEQRYGPAFAQDLIDQIKKVDTQDNFYPDYMPVKAASEVLETFRDDAQDALTHLQTQKALDAKAANDSSAFHMQRMQADFKRLWMLYMLAQKGYYHLFHRAMEQYQTPETKQQPKHVADQAISRAA